MENSLEKLEEAKQECMRLSTENGKVSMLIYSSEVKKAFNLIFRYTDDIHPNLGGNEFKQNMHRIIQTYNHWKSLNKYIYIDFNIFYHAHYNCTVKR